MSSWQILHGDVRERLKDLEPGSVQCVVTSPPYWGGLRDYGHPGQLGLERDPSDYVASVCAVIEALKPSLRDDGTLWVNVGDVYAASGKGGGGTAGDRVGWDTIRERKGFRMPPTGYKMKDLTLVAFQLAHAIRSSGWYLRSTIIWRKPAAVEPMRLDRPAVSHEYLFLFAKSEHYYARNPGEPWWGYTVWDISTEAVDDFPAAMPRELVRRCLVCSSRPDDLTADTFCGSGTVGVVAIRLQRRFVGIELNADYVQLARKRIGGVAPLLAQEIA